MTKRKKQRAKRRTTEKAKARKAEANYQRFVGEYLANGRNGAAAYRKVFPKVSDGSVYVCAHEYLRKPNVQERLAKREAELLEQLNINQLSVLTQMRSLAFFDIRKLYNEDGSLKAPHELDDETARALASVEVDELFEGRGEDREHIGRTKKVRVWDRGQNLERLMRYLGMFKDKDATPLGDALEQALVRKVFVIPKKPNRADSPKSN